MRVLLFVVVLTFSPIAASAQSLPEWYRVYTFDESTIDMNTSVVTPIGKDVSRVRFRWTFDEPQSLGGVPEIRYQSQLEVMEFNCQLNRYRSYHLTYFSSAGNIVRIDDSPGQWQAVSHGYMIDKLFQPACDLIRKKTRPSPEPPSEKARLEKVALFAYDFGQDLERTKDFKPLIDRFFVPNYLIGYLHDQQTNWFVNLDHYTAARLSLAELQRFYVALMNADYLCSLYLISQVKTEPEDSASFQKLLPPDVLQLLKNHRYTTRYKSQEGNYDFMLENINSIARLRSYTDLLERLSARLRPHLRRVRAAQSKEWREMQEDWALYQPTARVCSENCLGLPAGTKLFEVNVPVFRLQVAEVRGKLKVVSAMSLY